MTIDIMGDAMIIRPEGELDHHYASEIREKADRIILKGEIRKVVFDFTKVHFMDSSGIGVIMGRYRLMEAIKGSVCAFGTNQRIKDLVKMSGLSRLITIYPNQQKALEVK
ncbi:MAG: anti-sigma factor antagonist [Clostridia bacterium]|nr:anti-sigma factor antagonist [Clostridia bacterium]